MSALRLAPVVGALAAATVLTVAVTLSGGCSESAAPGPDLTGELKAVRESLDASRESSERLSTEVQRQSRRIDDLSRRVTELSVREVHASSTGGEAGAPGAGEPEATTTAAGESPPALATEVAAVLASEDGKKVVAAAARGVLAEREARQRDAFVAYSLATFAQEADLSETQTTEMREAWDDVMADARKLIRDAAPTAEMTPEQRAEKVQAVRTGMQDLGRRREERMRSILDDTQFALYKEREKEIDAGLHGAPAGERRTTESDEASGR